MKWIEARVVFDALDKQLATDLISNLFYDIGLKGVVIEDPELEGSWSRGDDAAAQKHYGVIGYIPYDDEFKKRRKIIEKNLVRLDKENGIQYDIIYSNINETDWAETWKAYFHPEKITPNIVVKPTWHEYSRRHDEIILEIDPGMAFGTGTHPTTWMCITMMEKYLQQGNSFLDVGTGSGILMVAAAKIGAKTIYGVDNDQVALDVARKNLIQNQITDFNLTAGNFLNSIQGCFNFIASNLTTKGILILLEDVKRVLIQGGTWVCSGIVETDQDKILKKMEQNHFTVLEVLTTDNWVSIACRHIF